MYQIQKMILGSQDIPNFLFFLTTKIIQCKIHKTSMKAQY